MESQYLYINKLTSYTTAKSLYCRDINAVMYTIGENQKVSIKMFPLGDDIYSFSWQDAGGKHTNILMQWGKGISKSLFRICVEKHSKHPATRMFL